VAGRPRPAPRGGRRRGSELLADARLRGHRDGGGGPREGAGQHENLSNKIAGLQVLANAMAVLGLNRSMTEEVADARDVPGAVSEADLDHNLTAAQVEDTRFLSLTYTDRDPDRAQAVANTAAEVFAEKAPAASGMVADATLKVSAHALTPSAREGPNPVRNSVLAGVLGLMLGLGLVFLLERSAGRSPS
jgi:capsular polysaccharide biosynthesis protein